MDYTITLNQKQLEHIIEVLGEKPYVEIADVIANIYHQAPQQVKENEVSKSEEQQELLKLRKSVKKQLEEEMKFFKGVRDGLILVIPF